MNGLVNFEWRIHPSGYQTDGNDLLPVNPDEMQTLYIVPPALFGELIEVQETDAQSILAFVNKYGPLTNNPLENRRGENAMFWRTQVKNLLHTVNLWQLIEHNEIEVLQKEYPASKHPLELARTILENRIAEQMKVKRHEWDGWDDGVETDFNLLDGLKLRPQSLLAIIWLRLADAVMGHTHYMKCRVCKKWVLMSEKALGKNKMYCSNKCKQIAKRRKLKTRSKRVKRVKRNRRSS